MKKKIARQVYETVLLLFLTMIPFMRASAQSARVTLNMKNVPMEQVMNEIEKQTSYLFAVNDDVDLERQVTVMAVEEPLKKALDLMVAGSGIRYEVNGSTIFLTRRVEDRPSVLSGRVTDENGEALPGVSVFVKGIPWRGWFDALVKRSAGMPEFAISFSGVFILILSVVMIKKFKMCILENCRFLNDDINNNSVTEKA